MIKNSLAAALILSACSNAELPEGYQGVVEHEERVLGFEVGGRIQQVAVKRGDVLEPRRLIAKLDPTLDSLSEVVRASEAQAAVAQADLVKAGARPEDVRALEAQVRAARAAEENVRQSLERQRPLTVTGASPQSIVDDLTRELERATAEREGYEFQLMSLRRGSRSQEIEGAEARARAAEASRNLEQARVGRYELRAEHPGAVLDVHVESGEVLAAFAPVVTVADTTHPFAEVFVPQADVAGIRVGVKAHVKVDAYGKRFPAHVEHVARRAEFTPRYLFSEQERPNLVVRVRVRIDDPQEQLVAGIPTFVTIDR